MDFIRGLPSKKVPNLSVASVDLEFEVLKPLQALEKLMSRAETANQTVV